MFGLTAYSPSANASDGASHWLGRPFGLCWSYAEGSKRSFASATARRQSFAAPAQRQPEGRYGA
jgi:hypothetical protein